MIDSSLSGRQVHNSRVSLMTHRRFDLFLCFEYDMYLRLTLRDS